VVISAQQIKAEEWAKLALDHLKKDKLAAVPNNYAVYYYYFSGTNPGLKTAIDTILAQNGALTQAHCDEIFMRYLGVEAEHQAISETNAIIEQEVSRVLKVIDQAASGTSHFTQSLDNFSGQLTNSSSLENVREAVTKIVAETKAISKQNERLAAQLSEATQQLVEVRQNLDQVHKESQIDALTEVGNRKFFEKELTHSTAEARDNGSPLTLLMVDIDHFKKFNDSYGHLIGDQVLRLVAHTLVENLKGRDANQLRASLATKSIKRRSTNETLGSITISIGAAEFCVGEEKENFIARADAALYKAKQTGRNKVIIETLPPEEIDAIQSKMRVKY
jgi:diguanylate cyclase